MVISDDKVVLRSSSTARVTLVTEQNSKKKEGGGGKQGILAQRKMDGDRMQAHIMLESQGRPSVKLFTKRGRPVHKLYSDVAQELEKSMQDQPCILDGEIIVVDTKDGNPLPWSSTKWRYNSGNTACIPLAALATSASNRPINVVSQASCAYGYIPGDGEEEPLTFAPGASSLSQWEELGSSEKERLRAKEVDGRLLFVVFDVLMLKGKATLDLPYSERLERLKRMLSLGKLKHTKVISETWYVQNAEELMERMGYIVKQKGEGLILKDPRAKYEFTRSLHQRKLKISGPDINCGVVGLGFTQSRNPRMWGLLTCIRAAERLLVYNRVETLEGDKVKTAAEHVLGLPSLVPLHPLLLSSKEMPMVAGPYKVYATALAPSSSSIFTVTWESAVAQPCVVYFLQGAPKDVQWLCNPHECRFGLSQRGDVYPVDWRSNEGGDAANMPMVVWVPRFPVGRIQLDEHQRSELDSPSSIEAKFKEAANEKTCLQDFFLRKIRQLRTKPPKAKKLEELRRILKARENSQETWPQPLPTMYYLKDLSALLVKYGFDPLSAGERMVLSGIPAASQWDPLYIQQVPLIPTEEEEEMQGEYEAELPKRLNRMKTLKRRLKRPVLVTGGRMHQALACILQSDEAVPECVAPVLLSSSSEEEEDQ